MTMEIARKIAIANPYALRDLIRILLRPLQSEHLLSVAEWPDYQAAGQIEGNYFFFPDQLFGNSDYWLRDAPSIELNLACDPVLPTPWDRSRYVNALASIGTGKSLGSLRQDSNHIVSLWLPWGIGFVGGGNHFILSGILSGEKTLIVAHEVFDFSPILNLVECDGAVYRRRQDGKVLAEVVDYRRAAVFEIGRLMIQHQVSLL